MAKTIHNDLVFANATAWQWWLAISPYDYKDGLVYVDKNKADGNYYPSKLLWVLGNYSRFIKPGAVRVDVSSNDATHSEELFISSYKNKDSNQLITVIVNEGNQPFMVNLEVLNGKIGDIHSFITSAETDLKPVDITNDSNGININPRSVTTLISTII
jgi:O-glycosyl hydrolase